MLTGAELIARLADLFQDRKQPERPLVVGITGMDTSGKSQLATALAAEMGRRGAANQLVRIDDFHHSQAHRYRPDLPQPEQYYKNSIDFARAAAQVLTPIREKGCLKTELTLLDLRTDTPTLRRSYHVDAHTIVLVEGVFLFRPEVRELIDLFVFLDVREDVVLARGRLRDVPTQGEQVMHKYRHKYLPAQRRYLVEHPPVDHAEVIVDNSDWAAPAVLAWPGGVTGSVNHER
ncbi:MULTISPECIES: hypothetical protein [Streptomyces]|uniref:hypothetical protein n=1 Tax=Streptomyces TaxID=1883 RepID=UPI0036A1021F